MNWYTPVSQDLSVLPDAISYYELELEQARREVKISGKVERLSAELPGVTEHRFNQLQDIEAILRHLEIMLRKTRSQYFKKYLEAYNRQLSSRDAEKYMEGEDEVIEMEFLITEVSRIRNKYTGIMKGLEIKQWQLGNLVKLKVAGFDDFIIS